MSTAPKPPAHTPSRARPAAVGIVGRCVSTHGTTSRTRYVSHTPAHSHSVQAHTADPAEVFLPLPGVVLAPSQGGFAYQTAANANTTPFAPEALGVVGGDLPHNNMMPYVTFNFCIALQGVFPPRG